MNLVLALALLGASSASVWAGITDPEGGLFVGLRNAITGAGNTQRTNVKGAAFTSDLLSGIGSASEAPSTSDGGTVATSAHGAGPATGRRAAIVSTARSWLGVRYVWGGTTRAGVDCSGLVQNVFKANGINLPRVSAAQAAKGRAVASPQPGDLVAFGAPVHHIGIVLDGVNMIHAPNSRGVVRVESIAGCAKAMRAPVRYRDVLGTAAPAKSDGTVQA